MRLTMEKSIARVPAAERGSRPALGPIGVIVLVGAIAEVAIPWLTMWLSDLLLFDIPKSARWWLFGVPPILTAGVALGYYIWKRRTRPRISA